eukprot:scaffold314950_cov93-Cyclotella_meneghiniana.AAC.1
MEHSSTIRRSVIYVANEESLGCAVTAKVVFALISIGQKNYEICFEQNQKPKGFVAWLPSLSPYQEAMLQ